MYFNNYFNIARRLSLKYQSTREQFVIVGGVKRAVTNSMHDYMQ